MTVPILIIISTTIDFYSNTDQALTSFALRTNQIQNPFMLASIIIYGVMAAGTALVFLYILLAREIRWNSDQTRAVKGHEMSELW